MEYYEWALSHNREKYMRALEKGWYTDLDGYYWRTDKLRVGDSVLVWNKGEWPLYKVEEIDWDRRKAKVDLRGSPWWVEFTKLEYYPGGRVDRPCTKDEELERFRCLLKVHGIDTGYPSAMINEHSE